MDQLRKVNSYQLYLFWKNFSIAIVVLVGVIALSNIFPSRLSPICSLAGVAVLYSFLFRNRVSDEFSCMIGTYSVFVCLIVYTVVSVAINIFFIWKISPLPEEFSFLSDPFIPSLLMIPVCFLTMIGVRIRRSRLALCDYCKIKYGNFHERGKLGRLLNFESHYMIDNLLVVFGILSGIIWTYYLVFYINISQNNRDNYVFIWVVIIFLLLDELYFIFRYYNLYLDLKENDEIISPEELLNMQSKVYLRFYVICDNYVYVNTHAIDPKQPYREVIDTPFFTKRSMSGISVDEVKIIIRRMTGVDNGELRFFFGRKSVSSEKQSILRYFYFLDGKPEDYPELRTKGEWMDYDLIKKIYSENPGLLADISVGDTTRLATIMITSKTYNSKGVRKSKIKTYQPSFNLVDVRNSTLDFQDDKWMRIALFNSDVKFFHLRSWWRNLVHHNLNSKKRYG